MQGPSTPDDRAASGGRRAKSAGAFRTISEVADELDVAQHVLRFWESKFPQVRPLKRGGGRRYYRPEDVDLLRRIRSLLYDEGYTIKGAQKLLKGQRRSPADRTPRENGNGRAAEAAKPSEPEPATLHAPLDAEQKQALTTVRSELVDLRDSLRKLLS
ncbi:MAG: MerR family transcriptional regulator [Pseudomonadota bacterium]